MDELPLFSKTPPSRLSGATGRREGTNKSGGSDSPTEPDSPIAQQILATLRTEIPLSPIAEESTNTPWESPGSGIATENRVGEPPSPPEEIQSLLPVAPEEVESAPPPSLEPAPPPPAEPIPARMLNEFVYCARLFYYEHVEGLFVESADTLRGSAIHVKVDSGNGKLPAAKGAGSQGGSKAAKPKSDSGEEKETPAIPVAGSSTPVAETIHSRSVELSSERLGVNAKMDLVEGQLSDDLFTLREVVPVDYKAGAPREGNGGLELWDTDKMQLGLQALILRDNGYTCHEGVIYYRATKQRVPLQITQELEQWILEKIAEARETLKGPIPAPLVASPKCVRCSLAPVCLPDETHLLQGNVTLQPGETEPAVKETRTGSPRKIIPPRDETRPLYLNSQGHRVGMKGETLQVKDKETLVQEIRIRDLSHVALFGNIQISTQAVQSLCELDVPITYFSMGGWFYGITRGHHLKNIFLRIQQFRQAGDPVASLKLARQFVYGKIRNHRTLLMRNHAQPPESAVLRLKRAADDALSAPSLEVLLGIEGAAAHLYFEHLAGMIKVDPVLDAPTAARTPGAPLLHSFNFNTRNRRPPTDPVNALLSLSYSLLSKDCGLACLAVGLDPYVGFYHQPRFGRPALALDLMEEFRPLVAESAVLTAINNRIITETDFVRAGSAVNLSPAGRKRFFAVYEQRLISVLTHPIFDYKVTYRRALELQARLLGKALAGEIPEYIPLLTR